MKNLFILVLSLLICSTSYAQSNSINNSKKSAGLERVKALNLYNTQHHSKALNILALDSSTYDEADSPTGLCTKNNYFYDDLGRDTLTVKYYKLLKSHLIWNLNAKSTNTFNSNGLLESSTQYSYDSSHVWMKKSKSTYVYNTVGYLIELYDSSYDSNSNSYLFDSKSTLIYDALGNILERVSYRMNSAGTAIIPIHKNQHTYNSQSQIILQLVLDWNINSNGWDKNNKTETQYNAYQEQDIIIGYLWNNTQNIWDTVRIEDYIYNSLGKPIQLDYYNHISGQMTRSHFLSYIYDSSNTLAYLVSYDYNLNSQLFDTTFRSDFTYDNYNNTILTLHRAWNNNNWDSVAMYSFIFDINYLNDDVIYPLSFYKKDNSDYILLNVEEENYNGLQSRWDTTSSEHYFFSFRVIDNISQSSNKRIHVYPNPANEYVYFDIPNNVGKARLALYDITGKLTSEQWLINDHKANVKTLSSGIYIYKLFYQNKTISGKLKVE